MDERFNTPRNATTEAFDIVRESSKIHPPMNNGTADGVVQLSQEGIKFVRSVVTEYVFNRMPVRMLQLDKMKLVDRDAIIQDITNTIAAEVFNSRISAKLTSNALRTDQGLQEAKEAIRTLTHSIAGYAILSHTWLTDGPEVLYVDTLAEGWKDSEALRSAKSGGLEKVEWFCRIAKDTYKTTYGWMDSICIDRSSTSELDESIRSMYRWYLNSTVCIVYLSETKVSPQLDGMENDRWFKRGWTLQEYLAPQRVRFHDQNWVPLHPDGYNDKLPNATRTQPTLIQKKIEQATGIAPFTSHQYSTINIEGGNVIQQMRWAAKRETTRAEDRAYSLMGMFGVSFSIAYGEGEESAFFRLVQAILASKPADHVFELLAWGGRPVADEIHTTRLLPSGPECYSRYDGEDATQKIPGRRLPPEPMMLTHIGLRIRLVLIPIVLDLQNESLFGFSSDGDVNQRVQFKPHLSNPLNFRPVNVHLLQRYPSYPTATDIFPQPFRQWSTPFSPISSSRHPLVQDPRFALAIYTFAEDNYHIWIPDSGFAFLLGWYPLERTTGFGRVDGDILSAPLNAHSKINTKRPIQFARKANSRHSATCIAKEKRHMQAQSVELVTLYL